MRRRGGRALRTVIDLTEAGPGLVPVPSAKPRVLHLAFEDHRRPHAGGGARRTWEINRRLADEFDIEVVTTRYPGSRPRTEEGVRFRQCGFGRGHYLSILSYHACLPWVVARSRADLIIEDFASPLASALVPLFTRRRTLAIVQWLFARETSREYRLPFFVFEAVGLRLHRRYVAVSRYIADELVRRSRGAHVDVIYGGVAPDLLHLERPARGRPTIVFLGRFQLKAKGIDHLIDAFTCIADRFDADLRIVGDGPDRELVAEHVARSGFAERITVEPWADEARKHEVLAAADLVVVPSAYETFGLVALEAMAAGVPVVGFRIPALVELVAPECGRLVGVGDTAALAEAMADLLADPTLRAELGAQARRRAAGYTWDDAARRQGNAYTHAVTGSPVQVPVPRRERAAAVDGDAVQRTRLAEPSGGPF